MIIGLIRYVCLFTKCPQIILDP